VIEIQSKRATDETGATVPRSKEQNPRGKKLILNPRFHLFFVDKSVLDEVNQ
jgi:hypothetical protein